MSVERPNVIYLHSHDTGRHVGPYGYPVHTPNLQRLAGESLLYRQAFCCAPTCSPSRAALLTGQSPHASGMLGLHHRGFRLRDETQHLAHYLKTNGYATALVGVNHIVEHPEHAGYDRVLPTDSHGAADVGPAAAAFLNGQPREPFFFDIGFVETHRGRFPARHPAEDPDYTQPIDGLPDEPRTREDATLFNSAARDLDTGIGQVLDALAASGLAGRTLLICTTDHGISFPGHKCTTRDGGIEVMLLMRGPATASLPTGVAGGVCDALVSQLDLYPMICDYLGLPPPPWLEGRSLLPLLRGDADAVRDEVFAEITFHAAYQPERAVRTRRHKYVRRFGPPTPQPLSNLDDGLSKTVVAETGFADHTQPAEALYDLILDADERDNRVADPAYADVLNDLRGRLDRWMHATHDPLLNGPVAPPPGTVVNAPADYSAKDVLDRKPNA